MWKTLVIVVFGFLALSVADAVNFKDCGSSVSKINSVVVSGCEGEPCPLKRNTNVTVTVNFTPNGAVAKANNSVHGIIAGLPISFPLPDGDACHNTHCPTAPGKPQDYKASIFVKPQYPKLRLVVKWEMQVGGTEKDVFCFEIPCEIV